MADILTKLKTKDYNNELEEILEKKEFSNDIKNLLLNMLYQVETGYNDYKKVKIDVLDKKIIIKEIVDNIYENCNTIRLIEPSQKSKENNDNIKVNTEKKEIVSYPNEKDLLKAVYKISYKPIKTIGIENIISEELSEFLNIGHSNDIFEIIRDFNGWNWYTSTNELDNFENNIIYQNLKILTNNEFLYNIKNEESNVNFNKLVREELEKSLEIEDINDFMKTLYNAIYIINRKNENENNIQVMKDENTKKIKALEKEEKKSEELFEKQKMYMIKNRQIDDILNNPKKLNEEFISRNEELDDENKIFSLSNLTEILMQERDENEQKYKELVSKLSKINYEEELEEAKKQQEFIESLNISEITPKQALINLQKMFLKCFMKFVEKAETKKQIIELIYTFRYYCLLYYSNKYQLKDIKEIKNDIELVKNELINKSIKIKMINELSINEELNVRIISPIFNLRNMELKNIQIKASEDIVFDNLIKIEYLDNGLTEIVEDIEVENISQIKGLKFNRKINIFS